MTTRQMTTGQIATDKWLHGQMTTGQMGTRTNGYINGFKNESFILLFNVQGVITATEIFNLYILIPINKNFHV